MAETQVQRLVRMLYEDASWQRERNVLMVLLNFRQAMRAVEISHLRKDDFRSPAGTLPDHIRIRPEATKGSKGRTLPLHWETREAALDFFDAYPDAEFIAFESRNPHRQMTPGHVKVWFHRTYKKLGFEGFSSHSGRRTCLSQMAREANNHGGSLVDVQRFAGHARLSSTETYIDPSSDALRRMVNSLGQQSSERRESAKDNYAHSRDRGSARRWRDEPRSNQERPRTGRDQDPPGPRRTSRRR
jgi:integrase/recombinase XerD